MQLSEIDAFLAVIRTGSLSKAAEQLYITQPALSYRIQTLEKKLGLQLLLRNKGQRYVELTTAGKEFVFIAEKWKLLWEDSKAISSTPALYPTFRVAATQTLSNYVMPAVYALFMKRDLPIALDLHTLHYQECYEAVEKHAVDAVFVSRTIASNRVSALPIYSEKMVLLCNREALYTSPVHITSLPIEKGIYMVWNHTYAMWHEYWFGARQYRITADNMRLVEQIVATSNMWAIVPISAARVVVDTANLQYLPLLDSPPERPIYILTLEPQNEYTSLIIDDFISVMN